MDDFVNIQFIKYKIMKEYQDDCNSNTGFTLLITGSERGK